MSDFLTRLAQRAVDQGPRVHPLVAPLYAPYRDAPPPDDAGDPAEVAIEADARPAPGRPLVGAPPLRSSVPPVAPGPARGATSAPEMASPSPRAVPPIPPSPSLSPLSPVPPVEGETRFGASRPAGSGEQPPGMGPPSRSVDRQIARAAPPAPPGGDPDGPIDAQPVQAGRQHPPPESAPGEAGSAPPRPAANLGAADAGAPRERERAPARYPTRARTDRATEGAAIREELPIAPAPGRPSPVAMPPADDRSAPTPRGDGPADAAPGPTVRVTIGRIEVRAETPPPARRVDRERRGLSLDDYLRQRDGGAR